MNWTNWTPGEPYDWGTDWAAIGVFVVLGAIGFATGLAVKFPYPYSAFLLAAPMIFRYVVRRRKKNL